MVVLAILVTLIMSIVTLIHFYWAFGGDYGLRSAGPSLEGAGDFIPGKMLIFLAACLFSGLAFLPMQLVWPWESIGNYVAYIGYIVSFIFIIRGIGDFKYVGLFKKVYNSNFAQLDTKYFSPLILLLGLAYALLSTYGVS